MKISPSPYKLLQVGLVANIIEWYEFLVFIHLSAIIGELFFKPTSRLLSLIQTFALFAIGYFARPLGSLFFGYFGDKKGRSASLKISLLMMSIPTILIGLLPTYRTVGYFGASLLLILRLIQGFAAGGELPVTGCYVFENAPLRFRSLLCGVVSNSPILGSSLGSFAASLLFLYCDYSTIIDWAWRIPFLLGIPLTLWIAHIRKGLLESSTPDLSMDKSLSFNPLKVLLTQEGFSLTKATILSAFSSVVGVYVLLLWMPFYLTHFLNYPPTVAYPLNTFMELVTIPISLAAAQLAHYIGWERIVQGSILLTLLLAYPLFQAMQDASLVSLYIILFILNAIMACIGGVILEALGALFIQTRSLGMSIALTFPTAILGGITPLLCTYLTHKTQLLAFPALYIIALGLLALPVALKLKASPKTA